MSLAKDVFGSKEITCPYCGYEFSGSSELDDSGEIECEKCGKEFFYEREIVCTYNSTGVEE